MGNNNSNVSAEKRLPESWLQIFSALKLRRKEMKKLHKVFRNMDLDSDGIVTVGDILSALDIERTKFTERIFAVFDAKHDGRIDFREFVLSLWNYCTLGKASLNYFTFDLYDWDESGDLSTDQIHGMISDFFGDDPNANEQARAMTDELNKISASVEQKGPIDLETFKSFTKFHQAIVYRTFNVQMKLRNTILGDEFWEVLSKRRVKLSQGRSYMHINLIMTLRVGDALAATALQEGDVYLQTLQQQQDAPPSPVRSTDGLASVGVSGGSSGKEEVASTGPRVASFRPAKEGSVVQIASGSITQSPAQGSVPVTQTPDV